MLWFTAIEAPSVLLRKLETEISAALSYFFIWMVYLKINGVAPRLDYIEDDR
jgi:hypothetical protein